MSKLDAQRAMREAKYARNSASGPSRREAAALAGTDTTQTGTTPAAKTPAGTTPTSKPAKAAKPAAKPESGERCGHKSMNGRECTREAAHAEKSHRYG